MSFTENLIEAVKKHRILYDESVSQDVKQRQKAWDEIGKQLKVSGAQAKRKWKSVKDSYQRYVKMQAGHKPGRWFEQMDTLRPYFSSNTNVQVMEEKPDVLLRNECIDNIVVICEDSEEATSFMDSVNASRSEEVTSASPSTSRRNETDDLGAVAMEESFMNCSQNNESAEMDDLDMLFLAYARVVKKFNKKRQAVTKMKISEVIMEQELQDIEEQPSSPNVFVPSCSFAI
ncbi:Myb/SANT-like transcription factor [Oryctes borbonicus]|uniref:Myb/SANT-like transcription factor n=1 Tax=Oryctes borbonicus TaxID=1629725 RepID=A0A0T6AZ61_9SCAR|nr:Myb/SANT-like transcription factor [Oryctes borbonicus]